MRLLGVIKGRTKGCFQYIWSKLWKLSDICQGIGMTDVETIFWQQSPNTPLYRTVRKVVWGVMTAAGMMIVSQL